MSTTVSLPETRITGVSSMAPPLDDGAKRIGTVVGSYRLLALLGQGAMGQVFLADHTKIGRKVALKMLRVEHAQDANAVRRFFSEAQAVNRISHENIVEITDFVENPGGDNYFIMELLKGQGLTDLLKHEGILPLPRTLAICRQMASALAAVHDAGIVHRDLKPDNIFLIERGEKKDFVKLLDFGVAKLTLDLGEGMMQKTNAGSILGTPEYMSPEQVAGKPVDFRSDVYSFGILLYEMVAGRKPFNASSFGDLVIKHLTVTPPKPSKVKGLPYVVPFELETLIMKCLAKDPHKRPDNMVSVEAEIVQIYDIVIGLRAAAPWHQQKPRQARAVAAGVFGGAVLAAVLLARSGQQSDVGATTGGAPAAPAATPVELHLRSRPAGAIVKRGHETLGVTPLELRLPADGSNEELTFHLSGYVDAVQIVNLSGSETTVEAHLKAEVAEPVSVLPAAPSPLHATGRTRQKAKAPRQVDKGAVLDPFGD